MEDHLKTICYLIIGAVYFLFRHTKQPPTPPPPAARPTPAPPCAQPAEVPPPATKQPVAAPTAPPTKNPQPPLPPKQRPLLGQRTAWKRAILMGEIIRPYT